MSEKLAKQSELLKLARILDTEPDALGFLGDHDSDQLRLLREGVTDGLFEKFRNNFAGFARMTGVLPLKLSSKISEQVLGSMLSGRIASEMKPERAVEMTEYLPDEFLADTCLQLDPARSQEIIAGMPIPRVLKLTRILQKRREFITMGRFVGYMPLDMLLSAAKAIDDDGDLLQIGFFVEDNTQLSRLITMLPEARKDGVIKAAAEHDLWPEAIALMARVEADAQSQLSEMALAEDDATFNSLVSAATEHDLWPTLEQLARGVTEQAQQRLAEHKP